MKENEIAAELAKAPLWKLEGDRGAAFYPSPGASAPRAILRLFQFSNFLESVRFVNAIAEAAEKADHHPDILIQYSKVTLRLSTHDCNGLSSRDFALARVADELASRC